VYNWSIPELDTTIANEAQFAFNWNAPAGDYTVELQKITSDGCTGTLRDTLVMISQPAVSLGEDVSLCQGENHTFDPGTYESYLWQDGSTQETFMATTAGTVFVKVTNAYGCSAFDTTKVTLFSNPLVNLGNDTVLCGSSTLQLDAGDFESYAWSTGETTNPITLHAGDGPVSVTVTDENGCQATDEIIITECTPVNLIRIPNTFTPNEDGYHDAWKITNIESFPDADILVYDRWGRVVFKCGGGYDNNWKGTSNGNDLPVDTYYYVIDLNVHGSEKISGTVSIIR
jgi:gliding motility-associated-like protein